MLKEKVDLTPGSDQKVKCICDYCGREFERRYNSIINSRKVTA